mmetsp:Transcript_19531/g.28523  ORF Transcript_19531/g.28523 Transcript_19531/m.28523 type:complete len:222 (-) Transcript_19531:262-927(-)
MRCFASGCKWFYQATWFLLLFYSDFWDSDQRIRQHILLLHVVLLWFIILFKPKPQLFHVTTLINFLFLNFYSRTHILDLICICLFLLMSFCLQLFILFDKLIKLSPPFTFIISIYFVFNDEQGFYRLQGLDMFFGIHVHVLKCLFLHFCYHERNLRHLLISVGVGARDTGGIILARTTHPRATIFRDGTEIKIQHVLDTHPLVNVRPHALIFHIHNFLVKP